MTRMLRRAPGPGKVADPPGGTSGSILEGLALEHVLFTWWFSLGEKLFGTWLLMDCALARPGV